MKRCVLVFLGAVLISLAGAAHAQTNMVTVPYRVIAGTAVDLTSLNIYPVETSPATVVMFVHGGGWQRGDKSQVVAMPKTFNAAGYLFVSINYRLSPDAAFPVHAEDVAAAVAWVRDNIADYGGDPERLFLMGHSAGAHLAALVATDARYLAVYNMSPAELSGVIPMDTQAHDLVALADARGGQLPADTYTPVFGQDRDFWAFSSPMTYVTEGAHLPPFLLPYNSRGVRSRMEINEAFAERLRGVGGSAWTLPVERTHAQFVRAFGSLDDPVAPVVLDFINDPARFDPDEARRAMDMHFDEALKAVTYIIE